MRKGIIAIVIVAILMASLFWYFTQEGPTEQTVAVKEEWAAYTGNYCGIAVMLRADVEYEGDWQTVLLFGDFTITHPDGDIDTGNDDVGGTFVDDFCGEWTIEITPTNYDLPDGKRNVDGETYTHTVSVPNGQFVWLTFIFEWSS